MIYNVNINGKGTTSFSLDWQKNKELPQGVSWLIHIKDKNFELLNEYTASMDLITVGKLKPGTLYQSMIHTYNPASSENTMGSSSRIVKVLTHPKSPKNLQVLDVKNNLAVISWNNQAYELGETSFIIKVFEKVNGNQERKVFQTIDTDRSRMKIQGLVSNTSYHITVVTKQAVIFKNEYFEEISLKSSVDLMTLPEKKSLKPIWNEAISKPYSITLDWDEDVDNLGENYSAFK